VQTLKIAGFFYPLFLDLAGSRAFLACVLVMTRIEGQCLVAAVLTRRGDMRKRNIKMRENEMGLSRE
jgi:hypothetical protein